jgi:hypothetical protein
MVTPMTTYEQYEHHGKIVNVRSDLKGKHREHCLCYGCEKFKPDGGADQCPIAAAVYANCVQFGIVSPVWECPDFAVIVDDGGV